jgi:L-arabinokinase
VRVRTLDEVTAGGDLPWFAPAIDALRSAPISTDPATASFFAGDRPIFIARAPGRLDVMGGIADYSGSLVLEMPLARATFAIAQKQDPVRLDIVSFRDGRAFAFAVDLEEVLQSSAETLRASFAERLDDRWPSYVVGSVYACLTSIGVTRLRRGLRLLITSDLPEGKGVSSSAAVEVATMAATAACYGIPLEGSKIPTAAQWAENHIAGAPCGIMDQMTSALGRHDRLLRLRCQPATVEGHVSVPPGFRFYGIDSGIRHAVSGSDYGTVRTAAFMGYRIIADLAGLPVTTGDSRVRVQDDRWGGYLANIPPDEFDTRFADRLPDRMEGADFLARYSGITDLVTRVDPKRFYPVREATSHPVHENERVEQFAELLSTGLVTPDIAPHMGALMYRSHASYSACGLGSDGTDRLIDLVGEMGPPRGLFGAKITGGGSGGTVAVFGTEAARGVVHHIARWYEQETGVPAYVFDGSGPGAQELGVLTCEAPSPPSERQA